MNDYEVMILFENKPGNIIIRMLKKIDNALPYNIQCFVSKCIVRPRFGKGVFFGHGWKGYYGDVRFGDGVLISGYSIYANIHVGNYTIFAEHFRSLYFVHDYDCFSINQLMPEILGLPYIESEGAPKITNYPITEIGSDVWIGEFVTVKGGVHIGDGAVIAAQSVVTHDVEPYAIYGGVPARFIKWRFDEDKIDLMKKIKWFDWPKEKIKKNYKRLCTFDKSLVDDL